MIAIAERQELLDQLVGEMQPRPQAELEDHDEIEDDREIVERAQRADNREKFDDLCRGEWQKYGYPSPSEADFALISMLCFWTRSNRQVRRLFRYSKLGQREKAIRNDDYLNRAIRKIRASEPPPVDASALLAKRVRRVLAVEDKRAEPKSTSLQPPPGRCGELANYIHRSAYRPMPEAAVAAALALLAGLAGRQFFTSTGAGLNLYILLIALTGTGKEGGKDAVDRIVAEMRRQVPSVTDYLGPSAFASGQALVNRIAKQPCFVSVLAEVGKLLKRLLGPKASGPETAFVATLLDLHSKSGPGKILRENAYADAEKTTQIVESPAFSLLGDTTPDSLFPVLDESHVGDGLIPRFVLIESTADRPPSNPAANAPPPPELTAWLCTLLVAVEQMKRESHYRMVPSSETAAILLQNFDTEVDGAINGAGREEVTRQCWNRAHLNALRIATLLAVADNPFRPEVTAEHAEWSIALIRRSVRTLLSHFENGEVGASDTTKAEAIVRKKIVAFLDMTPEQRAAAGKVPKVMHTGNGIPFAYLSDQTRRIQPFKDKPYMLKSTLDDMVKSGALMKLSQVDAWTQFKSRAEVYAMGADWRA